MVEYMPTVYESLDLSPSSVGGGGLTLKEAFCTISIPTKKSKHWAGDIVQWYKYLVGKRITALYILS